MCEAEGRRGPSQSQQSMRTHLINRVTSRNTHSHRFTRTHDDTLTQTHTAELQKDITRRHTHAQSPKTRAHETQINKRLVGKEGALVRQGREVPHNFKFPHSRCVWICSEKADGESHNQDWDREQEAEGTSVHRSFAMN